MRDTLRLFYNETAQTIHFLSGDLGMDIGFDLWVKLDSGRDLFKNIEYILQGMEVAHNVTSVNEIFNQEGTMIVTLEIVYNTILSPLSVDSVYIDDDANDYVNSLLRNNKCIFYGSQDDELDSVLRVGAKLYNVNYTADGDTYCYIKRVL